MKEYKLKSEEIIKLVELKGGCIASDKITIDGLQIGYMYRENPSNESDSGWRFFAGNEDETYTNNPDNFDIFDLNTICNYDKTIIPYLKSEIGSSFEKIKGEFKKVQSSRGK